MAEPVKSKRRYESPRRREQAAATRREILEAAQRLFERQGYTATTMAAIATEAGVALKTVYVAFETKSGVLRSLWHLLLRGDQDDVPVPERPWYREIVEEPDPERQLRLTARNSRLVKVRAAALMKVIRNAASADPDVAALWSRIQTEFYDVQRPIVEALHRKKALRPGLDVDRRDRHPVDAQPSRPVAPARRRARLDARAVRAVVRRHHLRAARADTRAVGAPALGRAEMPLQNRVTPLGELVADPARGLVYGNRGCLHDETGRIRRRYNGKRWIACKLEFRGWQRGTLLQPGRFTELFFLDEATAFAAGHRPCRLCRYADYIRFFEGWRRAAPRAGRRGRDRRTATRRACRRRHTRTAAPRSRARRASGRRLRPPAGLAAPRARLAADALDGGGLHGTQPAPETTAGHGDHATVARGAAAHRLGRLARAFPPPFRARGRDLISRARRSGPRASRLRPRRSAAAAGPRQPAPPSRAS